MNIDFNKDPFTQGELEDIKKEYKRKDSLKLVIKVLTAIIIFFLGALHAVSTETKQGMNEALAAILSSLFIIWLFGDMFTSFIVRKTPISVLGNTKIPSKNQLEATTNSPKDVWECVRHRRELLTYVDKVIAMNRPLIALEVKTFKEAIAENNKKEALNNWISEYSVLRGKN